MNTYSAHIGSILDQLGGLETLCSGVCGLFEGESAAGDKGDVPVECALGLFPTAAGATESWSAHNECRNGLCLAKMRVE